MMVDSSQPCSVVRRTASDLLDEDLPECEKLPFREHLSSCTACASFVDELTDTVRMLGELRITKTTESTEEKTIRIFGDYFPELVAPEREADWIEAKKLWGDLTTFHDQVVLRKVRTESKFHTTALIDWLFLRARRVVVSRPDRALCLAQVSLEIARQLRHDPRRLILCLDCVAWCYVLLHEYPKAKIALGELEQICSRNSSLLEGQLAYLRTRGYYYSQVGRFAEARRDLEECLRLNRKVGQRTDVICALVNLTGATLAAGDLRASLELLAEARAQLDLRKDSPRLQLVVHSQLILAFCENLQPEEARALLPRTQELALAVGGWYRELYTEWLMGTLARVEHRYEEAEAIFERVRQQFRERNHTVWYVESTLDLARTYLQQGSLAELSALATELEGFIGDASDRRVRTAVLCFSEAVKQGTVSGQLLKSLMVAVGSGRLARRQSN